MSIFSSIGHALSTGYHDIFGGGNNNGGGSVVTTTTTMAPLQKPQNNNNNNNNNQPAGAPPPMLNLQKPGSNQNPFGVQQIDASTLTKAAQQPTTVTTTAAPPQPPKPSIFHQITHNPVTNVVGGVGKAVAQPFVQLGKGVGQIPEAVAGEIASTSSDPYTRQAGIDAVNHAQQAAFGTNDSGTIAKKIIGSTAGAMLTVAAPGLDNLAEQGATKALPAFAETGLLKVGSRVGSNAAIGGTFNTINGVENGQSPEQLAKSFGVGALAGGIGGAVFSGLPVLRKAVANSSRVDSLPARAAETASETATDVAGPQTADELATGITSVNPEGTPEGGAPNEPTPAEPGAPTTRPVTTGPALDPGAPQPIPKPNFPTLPELQTIPTGPAPTELRPPATSVAPVEPSVDNTPAYLRKAAAQQADAEARQTAEANAGNLGAGANPLDRPTFMHNQDIKAAISDGEDKLNQFLEENPQATQADVEQTQATIRQEVLANIQKLQDQRAGSSVEATPAPTAEPTPAPNALEAAAAVAENKPVVQGLDANGNPMQVTAKTAANQAVDAGVSPNAGAPVNPAEIQAAEAATALTPEVPGAPSTELKNARFNKAVVDNTKDPVMKQALSSDPITKDGQPLAELQSQATEKVSKMDLTSLVANYGQDFGDTSPVTNPQQYYEHLQALRQLEQFNGDPTAADAAANALAAVNDYAYRQGRGLAATKVAYDNLPASMKVAYAVKLVQKAGGDIADPTDLKNLYNAAEIQGDLAKTAQEAENAAVEIAANPKAPDFNDRMKVALATERDAQSKLYDQNRAVVDIIEKNLPKSDLGTRVAQQARTSMLSSVGGRVFALTGTGLNAAVHVADNTLSSVYGRGINVANKLLGRHATDVKTSFIRPNTLVKGAGTGLKGLAKETFGSTPVKSVDEHLKKPVDGEYSHDATRYGFIGTHITAPLRKMVRFGVGSHLAATKGIETSSLEQAARQAAKEAGVPKENLQGYVDYYKSHPPKQVADEAKQAWLGVNNLHQNGVSNTLSKLASGLEDLGGKAGTPGAFVAKQIRTVAIPFSHYMGGYLNKLATDRNLLYNAFRIVKARSPQELSDQLAHATTNVASGVGLGYVLAKNGVITDKDQDGKSYDGLYFHIGNKYIGVGWAGQAAMPIIMGARLHLHSSGSPASWPTDVFDDALKSTGVAGTFGDTTSTGALFAGDSGRGGPQIAGTAIRQHIPGVSGDVNAGLNYSSADPTHEKPLTKATTTTIDPVTGKKSTTTNVVQTEINKTKAAIPGLSQKLPRQPGEQAPSELDRMLHASEASGKQIQGAKDKQVQLDQSAYDKQHDIPDPNFSYDSSKGESFDGAVNARISNNEYDKAIPALQQKLDKYKGDKNVDPKTAKSLQNQIKELNVTKQYGSSGQDVRTLYKSTSLTEWRDMGDPNSNSYDPATYQKLYTYDTKLARQGVAGSSTDSNKNKFTAKTGKSGRGGDGISKTISSNTVGSTPSLATLSLGDLIPKRVSSAAAIPTMQPLLPSQLVKPRAISVTRTR